MTETTNTSEATERGRRKAQVGTVISNKMDKTIVVAVERMMKHRRYAKYIRRTKKLTAHDAQNTCNIGDVVRVTETRPLSKRKRWTLAAVISKAK